MSPTSWSTLFRPINSIKKAFIVCSLLIVILNSQVITDSVHSPCSQLRCSSIFLCINPLRLVHQLHFHLNSVFFPLLSTNFISFPFNFFNIGNRLASPTTPDVPCPFPNQYSSFWKLFGINNNKFFVILKPRHAYYYRCFPRSAILLWFTGGRNAFSNIRSAFCATTSKTSFSQVQEPIPPILSVAFAAPSPS